MICYFSAGSAEDFRSDCGRFADSDLGEVLEGFEGEVWVDIRSQNVFDIMLLRLDRAVANGCDGVEPDNVDGYTNDTGFDLTATDQLAFNRHLANEAHRRGLSVALKNAGDQAAELVDYFDFELNEQCHEFNECGQLQVFLDRDKPVLKTSSTLRARLTPSRSPRRCVRRPSSKVSGRSSCPSTSTTRFASPVCNRCH